MLHKSIIIYSINTKLMSVGMWYDMNASHVHMSIQGVFIISGDGYYKYLEFFNETFRDR